eukprot:2208648-Rhodomonas_salina.1
MGDAAASPRWTAAQLHTHIRSHNKLSLRKLRLTDLPPAQHNDPSRGDLPADFCVIETAVKFLRAADLGTEMVSHHTVKQEAAPVSPKQQLNKEGKKTRTKAKHAFEAKIEEYKGQCVRESMKIISNWNVFCHVNLTNVGFLNVNKAVAVCIDSHQKKAEIDTHNISHSPRAWVAMQHKFILFAGAGLQGGYAIAHVGTPIPFMSWDTMISSIPGGVHSIIDCGMVSAAKKTCNEEGIVSYLQHESMCRMQEWREAEQRVGALGWRHLPLELQGVIDDEDCRTRP